jgi:aminoglycoside/choline kinase family phosphotransferase
MTRESLVHNFLNQNQITNYQLQKIPGDASFRHYFRAILADKSFIIMDAPPEKEDVHPFCNIADFLLSKDFSAPKIFARDYQNGLLLLEDFGNDSYRKAIEGGGDEIDLYKDAVDLLVNLKQVKPPQDLAIYDSKLLLREAMLFVDWYLPNIAKIAITPAQIEEFQQIWLDLFSRLSPAKNLVLRDYHAENLMIVANRQGIKRVGLLDFQDAVIGSAAYDLVSLLEDARRSVSQNIQQKMLQHYLEQSNCDEEQFMLDYQILSLQRNIKIIGIFSRLAFRDHKQNYLDFLPRVFGYINPRLEDNSLFVIRKFLEKFIK